MSKCLPFLRRVQEEVYIPILLVSHDLSEILYLTQEMLMIDRGSVVELAPFYSQ